MNNIKMYPSDTMTDASKFLLHCYYDAGIDTLFILYKDYQTGKKNLKVINYPEVPVFLSKIHQNIQKEYIDYSQVYPVTISYAKKNSELKNLLIGTDEVAFFDKFHGKMKYITKSKKLPKKGIYLHPDLYMADLTIEECIYVDWVLKHYESDGKYTYEHVTIPEIDYAAFDIETVKDPDGIWRIHTNTFIDEKSKNAYLDYWIRPDFNKQELLYNDPDKFIQMVRDALNEAIESTTLKGKQAEDVKRICHEIADNMTFHIRGFNSEEELIRETTKTMLTDYKPDILMAFNTTYDLGMFQQRIEALKLPLGTLNERGIGYDDVLPPFASERCINGYGARMPNLDRQADGYKFYGDQLVPKKRRTYLNCISHTMVHDIQTAFYSARQGTTFASYSLESTATSVLGFGKFDYSHITNHITRLAQADYVYHSIYALIDSMLLLMINRVGSEYNSKLAYMMRTKVNIEETASSNSAIARSIQTDAFANGHVSGNNINKILKSMDYDDIDIMSKVFDINFRDFAKDVKYKKSYGGGLVSDPVKYEPDVNLVKEFNILGNEAKLSYFRKAMNTDYLDFKSHYPNQFITRNLSKSTLYGRITDICLEGTDIPIKTSVGRESKQCKKYDNFGNITLAIANNDIISYCNIVNNTPSLTEIIAKFSENQKKDDSFIDSVDIPAEIPINKDYKKVISVLRSINRKKTDKKDSWYIARDAGYFLISDGSFTFNGTRIDYIYNGRALADVHEVTHSIPVYVKSLKDNLLPDNTLLREPKNYRFSELDDSGCIFKDVSDAIVLKLNDLNAFAEKMDINGVLIILTKNLMYFPFKNYIKQVDSGKEINPDKIPLISKLQERHLELKETILWEFKYNIKYKDIDLDIIQSMQSIKF